MHNAANREDATNAQLRNISTVFVYIFVISTVFVYVFVYVFVHDMQWR